MFLQLLCNTFIANLPVRSPKGILKSAKWTLFPFSSYWRGTYEIGTQRVVSEMCKPGMSCWDLGAHFGFYTVGMAKLVGKTGQVVSVEPAPGPFKKLKRHVKMNRLNDTVKLYEGAASDFPGETDIILEGDLSTVTHMLYEGERINRDTKTTKVKKVKMDDLTKSGEIYLPDFVKVDVEGHAAKAIKGAIESIETSKPNIVISFHSPHETAGVKALLEPVGYKAFSFTGEKVVWDWGKMGNNTVVLKCEDKA